MLEVWRQLSQSWPILQTIWDAISVVIPLGCLLACAGLSFMAPCAEIIGQAKKRSAYGKCAKQLALLALWLGCAILVAARVWLHFTQGDWRPEGLPAYLREMSWLLLSLGVMLSAIYYFLWGPLKNMPVLHSTLGMLAAAQNCVSLACVLFSVRISAALSLPQEKAPTSLPDIFPGAWDSPIWSAAAFTVPAIFGLAAGFALCWLCLRRKKDDFGRDYYNAMLKWCAAWAQNSWLILLFLLALGTGLKAWSLEAFEGEALQELVYDCSGILLWSLPALFWIIIRKSALPLRGRWLIYLALPLAMTFMLPYFLDITFL